MKNDWFTSARDRNLTGRETEITWRQPPWLGPCKSTFTLHAVCRKSTRIFFVFYASKFKSDSQNMSEVINYLVCWIFPEHNRISKAFIIQCWHWSLIVNQLLWRDLQLFTFKLPCTNRLSSQPPSLSCSLDCCYFTTELTPILFAFARF